MITRMLFQLLRQIRQKVFTNPFPVAQMPDSLTDALQAAEKGWIELNPPVGVNDHFRGRLNYDKSACIGCKLCVKVCPAKAVTYENNKVKIDHKACIAYGPSCEEICVAKCPRQIFRIYQGPRVIARKVEQGLKMAS